MIVAIDIGNTAIKLASVDSDVVTNLMRLSLRTRRSASLLADAIFELCKGSIGVLALVSVVPEWTARVRAIADEMSTDLIVADYTTIPMPIRLANPAGVGSDRLLAGFAAARLYGTPIIVADLGTATTISAIDADGAFVGGAILPGIGLATSALATGTAQLPHVEVSDLPRAVGRDTREAISSGVLFGQIGAVRELVARTSRELVGADEDVRVVVTGGATRAPWASIWTEPFWGRPPVGHVIDQLLTLRGLGLLCDELMRQPD